MVRIRILTRHLVSLSVRAHARVREKEYFDSGGAFLDLGTSILTEAHILYRYKILVLAMVARLVC